MFIQAYQVTNKKPAVIYSFVSPYQTRKGREQGTSLNIP